MSEKIVKINIHDRIESSFPVLDVFVKVACHIARGGKLEVIGKIIPDFERIIELQPSISPDNNTILGNIIYVDNYGNSISNISKKTFQDVGKGRDFEVKANRYTFNKINKFVTTTVKIEWQNVIKTFEGFRYKG